MARIRSVKPELFKHDELYDAEVATGLPLRLAFIGLFTVADREGRFKWKPRIIKLDVLPYDDVDFAKVLDALVESGFLGKYEVDGVMYGCIPSFLKHQAINNRESDSQIPPPPNFKPVHDDACTDTEYETIKSESRDINASDETGLADSRVNDACLTREARVDNASPTPLFLAQGEGKGKEKEGKGTGTGRERERNYRAGARGVFSLAGCV